MHTRLLFITFALFASACIKRAPLVPSPLAADEAAQLQQALLGSCDLVSSQKEGGAMRKDEGITFTFGQDGMGGYNALGVPLHFKYQLDGRNVLMSAGYEAMRVDEWKGDDLKLFVYDTSTLFVCRKRR